jgi:hypothetical protein
VAARGVEPQNTKNEVFVTVQQHNAAKMFLIKFSKQSFQVRRKAQ